MTGGTVVVLGATGRNFAAGMTGGRAFVYDPHGRLSDNLNREYVDLFALTPEDAEELRALIEAHASHTGSARARRVLAAWEAHLGSWVKVTQPAKPQPEAAPQEPEPAKV
jgi:glutamate synthase (NADPH/NADH) large chain